MKSNLNAFTKRSSRRRVCFFALSVMLITELAACTTTNTTAASSRGSGKITQATTCPQCKMVAVTVPQPVAPSFVWGHPWYPWGAGYGWGGLGNGFGWGVGSLGYSTVYEDRCPGCKGVLKTFFTEGKWQHKCTVCAQKPFTCPVVHPERT